jgi:hypothetical protein
MAEWVFSFDRDLSHRQYWAETTPAHNGEHPARPKALNKHREARPATSGQQLTDQQGQPNRLFWYPVDRAAFAAAQRPRETSLAFGSYW